MPVLLGKDILEAIILYWILELIISLAVKHSSTPQVNVQWSTTILEPVAVAASWSYPSPKRKRMYLEIMFSPLNLIEAP